MIVLKYLQSCSGYVLIFLNFTRLPKKACSFFCTLISDSALEHTGQLLKDALYIWRLVKCATLATILTHTVLFSVSSSHALSRFSKARFVESCLQKLRAVQSHVFSSSSGIFVKKLESWFDFMMFSGGKQEVNGKDWKEDNSGFCWTSEQNWESKKKIREHSLWDETEQWDVSPVSFQQKLG